jgi:hypothetical protein
MRTITIFLSIMGLLAIMPAAAWGKVTRCTAALLDNLAPYQEMSRILQLTPGQVRKVDIIRREMADNRKALERELMRVQTELDKTQNDAPDPSRLIALAASLSKELDSVVPRAAGKIAGLLVPWQRERCLGIRTPPPPGPEPEPKSEPKPEPKPEPEPEPEPPPVVEKQPRVKVTVRPGRWYWVPRRPGRLHRHLNPEANTRRLRSPEPEPRRLRNPEPAHRHLNPEEARIRRARDARLIKDPRIAHRHLNPEEARIRQPVSPQVDARQIKSPETAHEHLNPESKPHRHRAPGA